MYRTYFVAAAQELTKRASFWGPYIPGKITRNMGASLIVRYHSLTPDLLHSRSTSSPAVTDSWSKDTTRWFKHSQRTSTYVWTAGMLNLPTSFPRSLRLRVVQRVPWLFLLFLPMWVLWGRRELRHFHSNGFSHFPRFQREASRSAGSNALSGAVTKSCSLLKAGRSSWPMPS